MPYDAKIIEDSIGPNGVRLTTFQVRYPRMVHSEIMTHRVFERNAKSSRAKPILKVIKEIIRDPVIPIFWGKTRKGMQSVEEIKGVRLWIAKFVWLSLMYMAIIAQYILYKLKLHKQIANRITEPWLYIDVLITGTNFDNFFNLRCHKDAQPELQKIAVMMARLYMTSKPKQLKLGEWHLPYITDNERSVYSNNDLCKFSSSRCARVSYFDNEFQLTDIVKDFETFQKLSGDPMHASAMGHQAKATDKFEYSGPLLGWIQFRKTLYGECCKSFNYNKISTDYRDKDFVV